MNTPRQLPSVFNPCWVSEVYWYRVWWSWGAYQILPKCRAPRGQANSFILKAFDNFVDQIPEMMKDTNNNNSNSSDDDDGAGQFDDTLTIALPANE